MGEKPKASKTYWEKGVYAKKDSVKYQPLTLVGAPGSGKKIVRNLVIGQNKTVDIVTRFVDPILRWSDMTGEIPTLGKLADYRTEVSIAACHVEELQRLTHKMMTRHYIYTNSLFSNLAHTVVRYYNMANAGTVSDLELTRWHHTVVMSSLMLIDTYPTNIPVIFLRGNDGEEFSGEIENALGIILNDLNFPHVELTSPEDAATMINKVRNKEIDIAEVIAAGTVAAGTSEQND